jgi:hypothetical protein
MNRIRNRLLHLLRQRLLQGLWHLALTSSVAHFARFLVTASIVDGLLRSALACWTLFLTAIQGGTGDLHLGAHARAWKGLVLGSCLGLWSRWRGRCLGRVRFAF